MKKNILLYSFVLATLLVTVKANATIRYVKTGSAGTAPYTTWATASNDLQAVINQCIAGDEIWIATGTYKPNRRADALTVITATDRNDAFVLKNAVKIYGGFTGVETLLSQRNSTTNVATLSGDIGTVGVTTDNCYHVVILANTASTTTLLDGVSIVSGNANAVALTPSITVNTFAINPRYGGGMYKVSSAADITDCKFRRNDASLSGGGVYETLSSSVSVYTNCSILQNTSADDGGGMYIVTSGSIFQSCSITINDAADKGAGLYISGSGSPAFTDCAISSNDAVGEGGAAYLTGSGSPTFTGCTVNSNTAGSNGGAFASYVSGTAGITATIISGNTSATLGGGLYNNNSPVAITNCLISGNLASGGGGINNAVSNAIIINCTIAGNRVTAQGGGIGNVTSNPTIQNCIVYGNTGVPAGTNAFYNSGSTPVVDNSLIEGGGGGTNINANPLFVNQIAASSAPTTTGDYRLQKCSPALNWGNNSFIPSGITTDLDGNTRINYGNVDLGAYEKQLVLAVPDAAGIVYVDYTKTGDGSSWANAVAELADAMVAAKFNAAILQIWVAKGTYYPKYNTGPTSLACNVSDVFNTFQFSDNLKMYGGFANGETDTAGRNFITNETILNGDIGVAGTKTDNCKNVVTNSYTTGNTSLNGFTVINGYSNSTFGTGMTNLNATVLIKYCRFLNNEATVNGGAIVNAVGAKVQILLCDFVGNKAGFTGGGIFNDDGASLQISNCNFTGNSSLSQGGGIANQDPSTSIQIANCSFSSNTSSNGAGVHISATPSASIIGCTFKGNLSSVNGGGLCCHTSLQISNCLFSGNKANQEGGAIHLDGGSYTISNCTIAGNNAVNTASAISTSVGTCTINNSIVYGNNMSAPPGLFAGTYTITNSLIEAGYAGTGNISTNPLFISPQLASAAPTTAGDYHLQKCSPAINAGSIALIPPGITKDLDSNNRIAFGKVDMGAYEKHLSKPDANGIVYVDSSNTAGAGDGSTWAAAVTELADALKEAKTNTDVKEIWVAKGTYKPVYDASDTYLNSICGTTDRDASFVLVPDVKIYGGFAGGETLLSQRNFINNLSILSGDIGVINTTTDNAYHVVVSSGNVGNARLDGVTVKSGRAEGANWSIVNGNFIQIDEGSGINIYSSSPVITNCSISENGSYGSSLGGGIYMYGTSLPLILSCKIQGNSAGTGGGICIEDLGQPTIANCLISGNFGGTGGGAYCTGFVTTLFTNCTISGNYATSSGGGISSPFHQVTVQNSIISENSSSSLFLNDISTANLNISYSIIGTYNYPGTGNYLLNPQFTSPQPPAAAPTILGDYHLQACSPALNIGDNSLILAGVTKDLDSLDRIKYITVDMGAYEMQYIDLANTSWKGVNTNWNDKINWCGGYIPYDTTNVIVPLTTNKPLIGAGYDNQVKNILFSNGTSIGVANTSKFTINGTYSNLGCTITNNGDWVMAGNAVSQTFPGTLATVSAMNNLEVNNASGLKFDKSFQLTGTLTPTAGNINVDNATVTFNSDATSTARVAAVPSGVAFSYTGTGKFEIERYIPAHRAWRLLTAPLGTATNLTISQAWQESVSNANRLSPVNPSPGFGTSITKSTTYSATDGYDHGSTNNPSIRYYNGTNWGGFPSSTIGTTLGANDGLINDKQGYMLFVRGDRSIVVAGTGVAATVTTLRPKGQLKVGPQTIACSGWTVIGNPYASPINFHNIVLDNPGLPDAFYVWDANLAGSSNVGGWVSYGSYNGGSQTYTVAPLLAGSTFANNKGDISSGSAFMVNYIGTITINENHKSTLGDNVLLRPVRQLSLNLYVVNTDSTESLNDGVAIKMDALPRAANAEKNTNFTENLAIAFDNKRYAIQNRQQPHFNDTIFMYTGQMKQRNYVLEIKADELNMPNRMKAYLEDTYLHQYKPVALEGSTRYAFSVNADSASVSAARFRLLFKKSPRFSHIDAIAKENDIEVQWQMEETFGIKQYEIERSINGIDFMQLQNTSTNRNPHPLLQNQWLDVSPAAGTYYYRIKATGMDGEVLYSDIAKAAMVKNNEGIYVFPNPVFGNTIQLRMNKQTAGTYSATLTNTSGHKIFTQQWQHSGGFVTKVFELPAMIAAGIYQLEIVKSGGKKEVIVVEVQR